MDVVDEQLENCRDYRRINKSNVSVRANILSLVSQESIIAVQDKNKRKQQDDLLHQNKILELALEKSRESIKLLNKSQSNITKRAVERYASHQHGLVTSSFGFDENVCSIREVSPSIVTPTILDDYKKISLFKRQKISDSSVNSDVNSDSNANSDSDSNADNTANSDSSANRSNQIAHSSPHSSHSTTNCSNQIANSSSHSSHSDQIAHYCTQNLPSKDSMYYKPYDVAKFLFLHEKEKIYVGGKRLFKNTLIAS